MNEDEELCEWFSPKRAAVYLDTTVNTLNDWRWRGKGPAFKRVGQRMVRYRRTDLDAFLEAQG